jgi:hypothetical protein
VQVDVHEAARGHTHLDLRYVMAASSADPTPPPDESPEVRWCSWEEARALADEALVVALDLARTVWETDGAAWPEPGAEHEMAR